MSQSPVQPPKVRKTKKRSNARVYIICICIALVGVLLSGVAGYGGYLLGSRNSSPSYTIVGTDANGTEVTAEVVDVTNVLDDIRPAVVEITTEVVSSGNSIFGQYVSEGAGSGVIISADGYIVTNHHVIDGARSISVTLFDGSKHSATLIGSDSQTDVAIIKIDAIDLTPAVFGNSDTLEVGEPVIAIGNPLGSLGGTVTTGIISAVGREIVVENESMTLLQTDAAINPGNSGGGLFNTAGQLIGIVNAKQFASGIEGLGFAIPISDVTSIIEDLIHNGTVTSRAFLNLSLRDVSSNTYYGTQSLEPGVYIAQIVQGGAADRAGLQVGDQIISINGADVSTAAQVKKEIRTLAIGDVIPITIVRDGKEITMDVELGSSNIA